MLYVVFHVWSPAVIKCTQGVQGNFTPPELCSVHLMRPYRYARHARTRVGCQKFWPELELLEEGGCN
jgi:hypothetical protein